jgi:hypothetical protein
MNLSALAQMIYEIFSPFGVLIAAFFIGFALLAAAAVLVVKALSFKP